MTSPTARTGWGPRRADRPGQASPSHSQPAWLLLQTQEAGPPPNTHTLTRTNTHLKWPHKLTHTFMSSHAYHPAPSSVTPPRFLSQLYHLLPSQYSFTNGLQKNLFNADWYQSARGSSSFSMTFCSETKLNVKPLNLIILDGFKFSLNV